MSATEKGQVPEIPPFELTSEDGWEEVEGKEENSWSNKVCLHFTALGTLMTGVSLPLPALLWWHTA